MLYMEIIAVCYEIHTKHINTLCGQNVELLNVKLGGTYSDHWAVKGWPIFKNLTEQCLLLWCCHITQGHYSLWLYKHLYRHSRTALPATQRWTQSLAQYSLHIFLFAPQLRKEAQVYLAVRLRIMFVFAGGCRSSSGPAVLKMFWTWRSGPQCPRVQTDTHRLTGQSATRRPTTERRTLQQTNHNNVPSEPQSL